MQSKLKRLNVPPAEPYDDDWKLPFSFKSESADNLVRIWLKTTQESTGKRSDYAPYAMLVQADEVIAKIGYEKAARALYNMASPMSRYYQYPYTLEKAIEGAAELDEIMASRRRGKELRTYQGFIGPVGMRNLLNKE